MIAGCPSCGARYRIDTAKLRPEGARLRCSRCETVFRVRPPEVAKAAVDESAAEPNESHPSQDGPARTLVVAHPDPEAGKQLGEQLVGWGLTPVVVQDGVDAVLQIQRVLPVAVILDAALPKMFGFQICELMKRNTQLRAIPVILVGAIHDTDRYRRPAQDHYGADAYLERHELGDRLESQLRRFGLPLTPTGPSLPPAPPSPSPAPAAPPSPALQSPRDPEAGASLGMDAPAVGSGFDARPSVATPPPRVSSEGAPASPQPTAVAPEPTAIERAPAAPEPAAIERAPAAPEPTAIERAPAAPEPTAGEGAAPSPEAAAGDEDPEIQKGQRLARIIVSDVILYNQETFEAALGQGNVVEALASELEEGYALFAQRVDTRVCDPREFLQRELVRVARSRGMPG